jgi:DNA-binding NarL/FixJ family response regulator
MKMNVIIADDSEQFRTSFKLLLKNLPDIELGEIFETNNGRDCIELVENNNIHIVFMDAEMPIIDGETATKHLRDQNRYLKIFAVSFHNEINWVKRMLDAGASNYFFKDNINIDNLIKALKN